MPKEQHSLSGLPTELVLKILSHFDPLEDIRTLRYVNVAVCQSSKHKVLRLAVETVLQEQRTWLLDRWRKIHANTRTLPGSLRDATAIAELVIGKQYVEADEDIDGTDIWAFKRSDFGVKTLRICGHDHCRPVSCVESPEQGVYSFDTVTGAERGMKTPLRLSDPSRLNIEVAFIPGPPEGTDARTLWWRYSRFTGFNGICVGVFLG